MADPKTVLIVDDDALLREFTSDLLRHNGYDVELYDSGDAFLSAPLSPETGCVLLDIHMPGTDGIAVMRALDDRDLRLPIVVLTAHGDIAMAVEAMKLGAEDFLEKPCEPADLIAAVARASRRSARDLAREQEALAARMAVDRLSGRQRDVLRGLLEGKQSKVIAHDLDLSVRTIEAYRGQLMAKLGVRSVADAVRLALAAGFDGL